jgi:hypothetical protein
MAVEVEIERDMRGLAGHSHISAFYEADDLLLPHMVEPLRRRLLLRSSRAGEMLQAGEEARRRPRLHSARKSPTASATRVEPSNQGMWPARSTMLNRPCGNRLVTRLQRSAEPTGSAVP